MSYSVDPVRDLIPLNGATTTIIGCYEVHHHLRPFGRNHLPSSITTFQNLDDIFEKVIRNCKENFKIVNIPRSDNCGYYSTIRNLNCSSISHMKWAGLHRHLHTYSVAR